METERHRKGNEEGFWRTEAQWGSGTERLMGSGT